LPYLKFISFQIKTVCLFSCTKAKHFINFAVLCRWRVRVTS